MNDIVQRVACKAVIANDNKVLLLREAGTYVEGTITGRYCIPGGRINPGEPLSVAEWFPAIHGVSNHIVAIFFVCKPLSGRITLSDEHDEYQWCTYGQAKNLDIMPADDKALEKFFKS